MNQYLDMWKNGLDFSGTTKRKDFWIAVLVNFVIIFLFSILIAAAPVFKVFDIIYAILEIIPFIALGIRRLRDAEYSPYFMFIGLIPVVGEVILILLWCKE